MNMLFRFIGGLYCRRILTVLVGVFIAVPSLQADELGLQANTDLHAEPSAWQSLLDDSLSHWDNYLSYRFEDGYDGTKPAAQPIGVNTSQAGQVFSVIKEQGEPVLRVSGEIYGALTSRESHRNYRLKLKVKWGEKKWPPRTKLLRDTGILYHAVGPHGAEYWRSWMLSQEFQIMEGHMGDYWSQATSAIDIRAYIPEYIMNPVASLSQPFLAVGHKQPVQGFVLRRENRESPPGQWTELELICFEGQSLHIVNGEVVMVLRNSRYKKNGKFMPLVEGKIQLQSEAAEVYFKQIKIQKIDAMPKVYRSLF